MQGISSLLLPFCRGSTGRWLRINVANCGKCGKMRHKLKPLSLYTATGGELGSVGHAIENLELYAEWLENRLVSAFDKAVDAKSTERMAEVAAIMVQFGRETVIVNVRGVAGCNKRGKRELRAPAESFS